MVIMIRFIFKLRVKIRCDRKRLNHISNSALSIYFNFTLRVATSNNISVDFLDVWDNMRISNSGMDDF